MVYIDSTKLGRKAWSNLYQITVVHNCSFFNSTVIPNLTNKRFGPNTFFQMVNDLKLLFILFLMEAFIAYLLQFGDLNTRQIDFVSSKATVKGLDTDDYFAEAGKVVKQVGFYH